MMISWLDFKKIDEFKFDRIVNTLAKNRNIDRAAAIQALDEEYTFEKHKDGKVLITRDVDGKYLLI